MRGDEKADLADCAIDMVMLQEDTSDVSSKAELRIGDYAMSSITLIIYPARSVIPRRCVSRYRHWERVPWEAVDVWNQDAVASPESTEKATTGAVSGWLERGGDDV
jgi:hypothetical protein